MTKSTVGHLATGVMSCGLLGVWATFSLHPVVAGRVVGAAGIVAFVLALIALRRRSWTRLPLVAAGWFAGLLVVNTYFPDDDPMSLVGLGYVLFSALLVVTGGVTLFISLAESEPLPSSPTK